MTGRVQRLVSGQRIPSTANEWNQVIDSVDYADDSRQFVGVNDPRLRWWHNAIKITCPDTIDEGGVTTGQILIPTAPLTDPAIAEDVFLRMPVFIGGAPVWDKDSWGKAVILATSVAKGEIKPAYFCGVTRARLLLSADWHGYCDIDDGETFDLKSHPSGSWKIMWTDATAGGVVDWAMVKYVGVWQRELKCQVPSDGELLPGTSNLVNVSLDGVPADDTKQIMVTHDWFDQLGNPIGADSKILAKWFPDQLQWVVVAAEC